MVKRVGRTIDKCKLGDRKINTHTHDEASPAAANGPLRTALFRPGTRAICKCAAGECAPADCDELYILDAADVHVATFHGTQYRATDETNSGGGGLSGLCVYRLPTTTGDAATDAAAALIRNRLAEMNLANQAFWARRDAEE
jgi:hypothetical protein